MMYSFTDLGEKFLRCDTCKRIGKEGWAHVCQAFVTRGNWYASVVELRAALAKTLPPGTVISAKDRGRR
jgi:hypothetical protein